MRALGLLLLCALIGATARAVPASESPEKAQLGAWLAEVHRSDELAMQLGRLAARRASSRLVRRYGDRLERDQRDFDHRLFKLARKRSVTVAELDPDAEQELAIQRLRALNGRDFDRLFAQVAARQQERQERQLASPLAASDVRRLVARLLPLARQDAELARYLQRREAGG